MVGFIDGFDVVKIRTPILDITLLTARNEPVVTMGPGSGRNTGLKLVIVRL